MVEVRRSLTRGTDIGTCGFGDADPAKAVNPSFFTFPAGKHSSATDYLAFSYPLLSGLYTFVHVPRRHSSATPHARPTSARTLADAAYDLEDDGGKFATCWVYVLLRYQVVVPQDPLLEIRLDHTTQAPCLPQLPNRRSTSSG